MTSCWNSEPQVILGNWIHPFHPHKEELSIPVVPPSPSHDHLKVKRWKPWRLGSPNWPCPLRWGNERRDRSPTCLMAAPKVLTSTEEIASSCFPTRQSMLQVSPILYNVSITKTILEYLDLTSPLSTLSRSHPRRPKVWHGKRNDIRGCLWWPQVTIWPSWVVITRF